ncbi:hypothetical protein CSHISOI_11238 [Colletotrichum shisoi]|uniref:ThuA-like domain-containing protein n=1 Tax=Colletotrichum shisoi TaxID=2078593 RepID=A0A5Q4BBV4_9PEZI|nr:hypothetical protein CSHISOI_11238 [Colletotrichum shisoi]
MTSTSKAPAEPFHILVFSKTSGFRHDSIPTAVLALKSLGTRTGLFAVDASEDAEATITLPSLATYATAVFLHCTGNFLDKAQLGALRGYVQSGGGFLVGAHFDQHPPPEEGVCIVEDPEHFITRRDGGHGRNTVDEADQTRKQWTDEWYNFLSHPRNNKNLQILARGDPSTFEGGVMGDDHPLAWCQEFDGGRSFYMGLGHYSEAYKDGWFIDRILRAIAWTASRDDISCAPSCCSSHRLNYVEAIDQDMD